VREGGCATGVLTPKRMNAIEPMVRRHCAGLLDSLIDAGSFDVITDFAVFVPMRTIGFLLGIPEAGQDAVRRDVGERLRVEAGGTPAIDPRSFASTMHAFAPPIHCRPAQPAAALLTQPFR